MSTKSFFENLEILIGILIFILILDQLQMITPTITLVSMRVIVFIILINVTIFFCTSQNNQS